MRKLQFVFIALAVLCFAIPVFADGGSPAVNLVPIGVGPRHGTGRRPVRTGSGQELSARPVEALARNPGTRPGIMLFLVLGLAFIESLTLFTLVIDLSSKM